MIATSTPNRHIDDLAKRYDLPVWINPAHGGIGSDWNFALEAAPTPWVTLAHQDDVYLPDFAYKTLAGLSRHTSAVLAFSRYGEIEGARIRPHSSLIRIKNMLLELGFLGTGHASTRFFKTNALRFGCAIACPAVTLNQSSGLRFRTDLQVDLDWAAWLQLAGGPGTFVYIREQLMLHRVHSGSETSNAINSGRRAAEDAVVLKSLWPDFIANTIIASYDLAYRSNKVSTES